MATGRKTGGRKKGVPNKATVEKKLRATKGIESAAESGVLPLDVMLARMRSQTIGGKNVTDDQFAAAVAAAPYIHPRLSSVDSTVKSDNVTHVISDQPPTAEEWEQQYGGDLATPAGSAEGAG